MVFGYAALDRKRDLRSKKILFSFFNLFGRETRQKKKDLRATYKLVI